MKSLWTALTFLLSIVAFADTPPPTSIFAIKAGTSTGMAVFNNGVISNLSCSTVGYAPVWNGTNFTCSPTISGVAWGAITGTLSAQTDLQSALNAKQNTLGFTPENVVNKSTDGTFAANSDTLYPSQKAAKTYVDSGLSLKQNVAYSPSNPANWLQLPTTITNGLDVLAQNISSAPTKRAFKALVFSNLSTLTNFALPFAPAGGYVFQEGDLLLYDGQTPGNPGDYTATGGYVFHDNGNGTGSLTRAVDWQAGAVIQKGSIIHVQYADTGSPNDINAFLEINTTVTVGAGDILPAGYNYLNLYSPALSGNWNIVPTTVGGALDSAVRHPFGKYQGWITAASDVNINVSSFAPGSLVDGVAIADGDRDFLLNQTDPTENGIWVYNQAGQNFSRDANFSSGYIMRFNDEFFVYQGDTYGQSLWLLNHGFVVGSAVDQNFFDPTITKTLSLLVTEGVRLKTSGAQPICDSAHRGLMWNLEGAPGVADIFQICQKDAANNYSWATH